MSMINVNVGLLGHVDSGKTALAKALSQTASTAAFDKSPQSQERGITLDLGFSACEVTRSTSSECNVLLERAQLDKILCTFVDCPGHASLIRTVVGGAQIIDVMILVIDATKGVQAQSAECLVLGEILAKPLVVVINKIDAIPCTSEAERTNAIDKLARKLRITFNKTRWPIVPIISVAASPAAKEANEPLNTSAVIPAILSCLDFHKLFEQRQRDGVLTESFVMLVDHCFALRGHGTVFTGTVLRGCVHVNDNILIPEQQLIRKVKSLQIFKHPVTSAQCGDRIGLGVTQFDHTLMERGIICSAINSNIRCNDNDKTQYNNTIVNNNNKSNNKNLRNSSNDDAAVTNTITTTSTNTNAANITTAAIGNKNINTSDINKSNPNIITLNGRMENVTTLVAEIARVRFHTLPCDSHTKFHITLGHSTVMGQLHYFRRLNNTQQTWESSSNEFEWNVESEYVEELIEEANMCFESPVNVDTKSQRAGTPTLVRPNKYSYYAIISLERPLWASVGATLIAMRLDIERENVCRIALAGKVCALILSKSVVSNTSTSLNNNTPVWRNWPIVRRRERELWVDRVVDSQTCIALGVISVSAEGKKNSNNENKTTHEIKSREDLFAEIQKFVGLKVQFVPVCDTCPRTETDDDDNNSDSNKNNNNNNNNNYIHEKKESDYNAACVNEEACTGVVNGTIESTFGHTGKVKLHFDKPIFQNVSHLHSRKGNSKGQTRGRNAKSEIGSQDERFLCPGVITIVLKKYPLALHSTIVQ